MKIKNKIKVIPILLAGGNGTRLWPASRVNNPKQFLKIKNISFFEKTIRLIERLSCKSIYLPEIVIVTNEEQKFLCKQHLSSCRFKYTIIVEPISKNTLPSVALATSYIANKYTGNIKTLIMSTDHFIKEPNSFIKSLHDAIVYHEDNQLMLFGVKPNFPSKDYGYLCVKNINKNSSIKSVVEFKEKPDSNLAKKYLRSKRYLWNSGIFLFSVYDFNNWLRDNQKYLYDLINNLLNKKIKDLDFICVNKNIMKKIVPISIDYGFVEKLNVNTYPIFAIEIESGWSDIGNWNEFMELNNSNNLIPIDSVGTSFYSLSNKSLVVNDLSNISVVDTEDVLFISSKNSMPNMSKIYNQVKKNNPKLLIDNLNSYRPWGFYTVLADYKDYKIKEITVFPKSQLSYQSHKFRSEHWIVISGSATVKTSQGEFLLKKNQSTFIKKNQRHSLINNTRKNLKIIEVQTGDKLAESDIVRYSDIYNRVKR